MFRISVDGQPISISRTIDGLFTDPDNLYFKNPNAKLHAWNQLRIYYRKNHRWHLCEEIIGGPNLKRKEANFL